MRRPVPRAISLACAAGTLVLAAAAQAEARWAGRVVGAGDPVVGAMVTLERGDPSHAVTGFTDAAGAWQVAPPAEPGPVSLRVRRLGYRDLGASEIGRDAVRSLELVPEDDPAALAAQLPANHWYALLLAKVPDADEREELKRQCTFCHQQGNAATRLVRSEEEWRKVLHLMGRMGGLLSRDLRERLPALLNEAYDPAQAVPALTAGMGEPGFAPPPSPAARRATVEEWELGGRASMQHDVVLHPDGRLYSVDMAQDQLYRLDPASGVRASWSIPRGDLPLGGVFATTDTPLVPTANSHVGPHSIQVAPDGAVWITLALGNQLARFDPASESWSVHELPAGYYPHTLRFDARGRIWYTISASNHLGMFDPATGESHALRLPARTWAQAVTSRALPFLLWLGRHVDLRGAAADGDGMTMPVPYGVDVAPDGSIWFSQLNEHRIGRVDPDTFDVEVLDTPFPAPRRLRFDADGMLWIPSFSGDLIARFDPRTRTFDTWPLPIEPPGTEVPYALNVDRSRGLVWICGTNSDTLLRFDPASERFAVYPLPTRVTYTRELVFDERGRVWTSNSNTPAWQIEGGVPKVLRLDPGGSPGTALARSAGSE